LFSQQAIQSFIWRQEHLLSTLFRGRHVLRHDSDCSTRWRAWGRWMHRRGHGRLVVGHGFLRVLCWHALASLSTSDLHDCLLFRSSFGRYGGSRGWRRGRRRRMQWWGHGRLVVGHGFLWVLCWHALASLSASDLHDCLLFQSPFGRYQRSRWRRGWRRQRWGRRDIGSTDCRPM
jgi:hypothetical protein